jgi:steroid 5-alpha reductase family enzyme
MGAGAFTLALSGWLFMAAVMVILFFVQRSRKDAGIVDVGWAGGMGLLAVFYAAMADGDPSRRIVLAILAASWSLRLASHLLKRYFHQKEDGRYRMLREKWGEKAQNYFFLFFQVQALWAVMFSVPFLVVAYNPTPGLTVFDILGIVVWIIAVGGESVADRQLAGFRADPANRGRTCRAGLWKYSRHPNYFFEFTHWFAYIFLGAGSPHFWVTFFGPAIMLLFLYKVTGIPYTEKQALLSRGEDYREYQRTTSAFIPWFSRRGKS